MPDRVPDPGLAHGLAGAVRQEGVSVPVGSVVLLAEALAAVGVRPSRIYWAGRASLVRRPEDIARYDRAFAAYVLGAAIAVEAEPGVEVAVALDSSDDVEGRDHDEDRPVDSDILSVRYSPTEVLRHKDFASCSPAELAELHRLMARVRVVGPRRRSRRQVASRRQQGPPDVRRTLRHALRTGGESVQRRHLEASERPRRVVLLCDVSGSMEPYARALLRFVHAAVAGRRRVEAFTIGTRLTRLTRQLSSHDADDALRRAAADVADWSGGTRLGEGLRAFNDEWGIRGLGRGAVVVILSDGWDRGDPQLLSDELLRLRRVAHRIVWVNPLKATAGYAPLAKGMAAALPHLDAFVDGHDLASLESLVEVIAA